MLLGESAGYHAGVGAESEVAHGGAVAVTAFGGAGGFLAVDVRDLVVPKVGEVLDGEADAGHVVGPDHVHGARAERSGDHDDRQAFGELLDRPAGKCRADEDERFAAVVEQRLHGAGLVASRCRGAEGQLVAGAVDGLVELFDYLGVEFVVQPEGYPDHARAVAAK